MTASNTVDLTVRIGDREVATYQHEGKAFVEGREGTEYALRVTNPHQHRIKAVLSVDGVNIVNGKPSTGEPEEAGYILSPGETQTILGYRLDNNSVARFKFSKAEAGYAQKDKGLQGTTGVIGCRVWQEKVAPPAPQTIIKEVHHHHDYYDWNDYWYPYHRPYRHRDFWCGSLTSNGIATTALTYTCNNAASNMLGAADGESMRLQACAAAPQAMSCSLTPDPIEDINPFELGSTWGAKAEHKVTNVTFVADVLLGEVAIYYSTRAGLVAMGVDVTRKPKVAFPAAFYGQYAKPPANWVG